MLEVAEVGEKLDKATFAAREPVIRKALLDAQVRLRDADFSMVIVIAGAEGAGKGETVNLLLEWLDARGIETHALGAPTEEENEQPTFYRFWRRLPPKGRIAIFFGSWYTQPCVDRIAGKISAEQFERSMRQIVEFERMLVNEGVLLLKQWLHITKKQQRKNFERLESNPDTAWRVTARDWEYYKTYDRFLQVASQALRQSNSGHAPWDIIEAADKRYRHMTVAENVLHAISKRLETPALPAPQPEPLPTPQPRNIINSLDLGRRLPNEDYEQKLQQHQAHLAQLARRLTAANRSAVLVFEGPDAAGKGGCIRRIVHALDARYYRVIPTASPSDEERARPYLWRFWRTLPGRGHVRIYDRSWYGRVLVERIEGFCRLSDWQRAYAEINEFEEQLAENGTLVLKFWLAISQETQLARFREREATGFKGYKLTSEDWRNRDKWPAYEAAACDMVKHTSTEFAPWTLVEADDKLFARIKVLETLCERLEDVFHSHNGHGGKGHVGPKRAKSGNRKSRKKDH